MERLDRLTSWVIFALGFVYMCIAIGSFGSLVEATRTGNEAVICLISQAFGAMLLASVNLLRVRYAPVAPGVKTVSVVANCIVTTFAATAGIAMHETPEVFVLFIGPFAAATFFSLTKSRKLGMQL